MILLTPTDGEAQTVYIKIESFSLRYQQSGIELSQDGKTHLGKVAVTKLETCTNSKRPNE